MDKSLNNFFLNENVEINLTTFAFNLVIVVVLTYLIKIVYVNYSQSLSNKDYFSKNFVVLGIATCIVITIVKSSLALSLGLVGALSIVRFRNPVKNSFELVMFFALITLGISGTVGYIYTIGYFFILSSIIILAFFVEKFYQKRNKKLFSFSFNEGEKMSTLTIYTKKLDTKLSNNPLLISKFEDFEENKNIYRFASKEIEKLNYISEKTKKENLSNIISIEYVQN